MRVNHTWAFVHLLSNPDVDVTSYYEFISSSNSPQHLSQTVEELLLNLLGFVMVGA